MIRSRPIEVLVVGLAAAMLYSAPLRDAFAGVLLALLLWDRFTGADEPGDRMADFAVAAFAVVTLVTTIVSRWPEETLLDLRFYPYGFLLFFGARRIVASGRAPALGLGMLALVAVLASDVLAQAATGASLLTGRTPVWGRYTGSFPFPADVALLPILLPLTALAFAGSTGTWLRLGVLAATTAAVTASGTRSAMIALGIVVVAEALGRRRRIAMASAALLFVGFALAATIAPGPAERLFGIGGGTQHRFAQWRVSLVLARESPILGHGPHAFRRLSVERVAARDPAFAAIDLDYAPYPHSVYLEVLVGSGSAGLAALVLLLALPFRRAAGVTPELDAARIAVAAFAVTAVFDLSLKKDWVELAMWLPLGGAVGAAERGKLLSRTGTPSEGRT